MPESIPPSRHESGARTLHSARLMEFSELNPEPRCRIAPNCRPTRFSPTSILSKTPPRFSSNPSTSKTHASAPLFRPSSLLVAESLGGDRRSFEVPRLWYCMVIRLCAACLVGLSSMRPGALVGGLRYQPHEPNLDLSYFNNKRPVSDRDRATPGRFVVHPDARPCNVAYSRPLPMQDVRPQSAGSMGPARTCAERRKNSIDPPDRIGQLNTRSAELPTEKSGGPCRI